MRYRSTALSCLMALTLMFLSSAAMAQYTLLNLDSNQIGKALHTDPLTVNAWGLTHAPGSPWWVSDENSGWSTLYDGGGIAQGLRVLIPTAGNGPNSPTGMNGPGTPTGIVYNNSQSNEFQVGGWQSLFLFATQDGTISGWTFQTNANEAVIAVDNSGSKAVYTGLAITNRKSNNRLYAADMANNKIDVYDGNFTPVVHAGAFTDPSIPTNFSVFGIQDINGEVYVTYADTTGGPGGFVDKYTEAGVLVGGKHLISGAPLNQPWGMAAAPPNFGPLSNTLLVSNNINRNGTINAFDAVSGQFVGIVKDKGGKPFFIDQLWGIAFGDGMGQNGRANQLYFTAGPSNNLAGTFGSISF
jgi:uncharacterized protein (TIGR03118 family)